LVSYILHYFYTTFGKTKKHGVVMLVMLMHDAGCAGGANGVCSANGGARADGADGTGDGDGAGGADGAAYVLNGWSAAYVLGVSVQPVCCVFECSLGAVWFEHSLCAE
jgi:hypothetical protein